MDILEEKFSLENCISKEIAAFRNRCLLRWPAHSPDLNPLDFFLWSELKRRALQYTVNGFYTSRANLKDCAIKAFADIRSDHIYKACTQGVKHRLMKCIAVGGSSIRNYRAALHRSKLPYDVHNDNDLNKRTDIPEL